MSFLFITRSETIQKLLLMEQQYAWIIPFLPLQVPMNIGTGLLSESNKKCSPGFEKRFIVTYSHDL